MSEAEKNKAIEFLKIIQRLIIDGDNLTNLVNRMKPHIDRDTLKKLVQRMPIAVKVARSLPDKVFTDLVEKCQIRETNFPELSDSNFTRDASNIKREHIQGLWDVLDRNWPRIFALYAENEGFLALDGRKINDLNTELNRMTEEIRTRAHDDATTILNKAREEAAKMTQTAKETTLGVGLSDVQNYFSQAKKRAEWSASAWFLLSSLSGIALLGAAYFIVVELPPPASGWEAAYSAGIRLGVLGALAGITAFCLRMMRAYHHIAEQHDHRQRLANCTMALIKGTPTDEHRAIVLAHVVGELTAFGATGLIGTKEDGGFEDINPNVVPSLIEKLNKPYG